MLHGSEILNSDLSGNRARLLNVEVTLLLLCVFTVVRKQDFGYMICTTGICRERTDIFLPVKMIQQNSPDYCLTVWVMGKRSLYILRYLQIG